MVARRNYQKPGNRLKAGGINYTAILLCAVSAAVLVVFFSLYFIGLEEANRYDGNSCVKYENTHVFAVLIDHTDSITPVQKNAIEIALGDTLREAQKGGLVYFYEVNDTTEDILKPSLKLCSPGTPDEVDSFNGNRAIVEKNFKESFSSVIDENLDTLLNAPTAQSSPIMESIQSVAVSSFAGKRNENANKKLIIVSDLLQHTSGFSQYSEEQNFDDFLLSPYGKAIRSDMRGVDVEILFVNRISAARRQTSQLKLFWQMFFIKQGANSVNFIPL